MSPLYSNTAHSDWLQLAFETGLPGLLIAAAGLIGLVVAAFRAFRGLETARKRGIARRPSPWLWFRRLVCMVPVLHSFVDYPLRTHAVAVLAAVLLAYIAAAPLDKSPAIGDGTRRN